MFKRFATPAIEVSGTVNDEFSISGESRQPWAEIVESSMDFILLTRTLFKNTLYAHMCVCVCDGIEKKL